jgi:hypothetical protein
MKRSLVLAWAALLAGLVLSCDFTSGTSLNTCQDTIPAACGNTAHCLLGSDQYLQGQFPGAQTFTLRTTSPQTVTFSFAFQNRISPGTQLSLTSTEPDCAGQSSYTSNGDLFELAGASGILSFPIQLMSSGDHLVQFSSDAYCSYELRYQ